VHLAPFHPLVETMLLLPQPEALPWMQAKLWQQGLYFCGITVDIEIFPLKAMIVVMPARFSNLVKRVPN
jgi:hypothetical protein